jgi:hypothetical protein
MKKLVWAAVALALAGIFAFAWAPLILRSYVQDHYPGIRIRGNVTLRWGYVAFRAIEVNRPDVQGTLDEVLVDWSKNVVIHGGTLNVDLNKNEMTEHAMPSGGSIQGDGIAAHVIRRTFVADLKDVSFDSKEVLFKSAAVAYKGYSPSVTNGRYERADKKLFAQHLELPLEIPFDIPKVDSKQTVKFEDVTISLEPLILTFDAASLDPFFKVKSKSAVDPVPDIGVRLELRDLEVNHPWISPDPVVFPTLSIDVTLTKHVNLRINNAAVHIDPSSYAIDGNESCNTWVEALPDPLPDALKQAKGHFTGNLGFVVARDPAPQLDLTNHCKFECSAEPIASLRKLYGPPVLGSIRYMAYDKDDKLFGRTVGPGSKDWVPIDGLPPYVPKAFITLEDPGFLGHHGIVPQALENSFKDNLKLGKFFRGGSTISMQLSKNLWLRRHKTIGRKAQEALLTIALESCLSKSEILELYMNVVEFGPNLYGIGPAAKHYFNKEAEKLEPEEAFYLASILPHPRKAIPPSSGGIDRVRRLMRVLADRGFISEALIPVKESEVDATGWETE